MSGIDKYVKSILHFDTDFTDESGKVWSVGGTPTISAVQSKFGGKSLLLNGTTDCLSTFSSYFNFGNSDFTIDWWEYRTATTTNNVLFTMSNGPYSSLVGVASGSNMYMNLSSAGTSYDIANGVSMGTPILNAWTHYALVRSGNSIMAFQNGVLKSTTTSSASILTHGNSSIGGIITSDGGLSNQFGGYVDEFRVSKFARWTTAFTPPTTAYTYDKYYLAKLTAGNYKTIKSGTWVDLGTPADDTALVSLMQASGTYYPPKQSDLESIATGSNRPKRVCWQDTIGATIPTIKLSAVPNDKLLLPKSSISMYTYNDIVAMTVASTISNYKQAVSLMHFDTDFTDESGKMWSAVGSPVVSADQSKFGGKSLKLNGTTDYLTAPASTDFNFGTGDFTIDANIYLTSVAGVNRIVSIGALSATAGSLLFFGVGYNSTWGTGVRFGIGYNLSASTYATDFVSPSMNIVINTWYHVAVVRISGICYLYLDGNLVASQVYEPNIAPSQGATIGARYVTYPAVAEYFNGYIDELRVSKGARWIESFTPPVLAYTMDNIATIRIILSLDLVNYKTFNFTSQAWETIDPTNLTAVKTNGISAPLLSTITEAQWASLIGTSSGVAIGFLLSENSVADSCLLDNLAMTVNMKGSWDHAVYGTNVTYGYTNNNVLTVKLITAGSYKINYNEGASS
jgi:hypothetical protein